MGVFNIFKKKKTNAGSVAGKRRVQPERQEPPAKAKKRIKPPKTGDWQRFFKRVGRPKWRLPWWLSPQVWREIPWWGRLLIVAGIVGIVLAVLFAVQPGCAPEPSYRLSVAVNPVEAGEVDFSPAYDEYGAGTQVTLTATPTTDYEFVSWSGDASGTEPEVTVTMDSDKSVTANFVATIQEIRDIMPSGISGSATVYSNILEGGEIIEGFVELTGEYYSQDWSFDWNFEIINPEGREVDYWQGHWVKNNHHDFSFKAQYSGSYKIRVRHNSLYEKDLLLRIRPKGWS